LFECCWPNAVEAAAGHKGAATRPSHLLPFPTHRRPPVQTLAICYLRFARARFGLGRRAAARGPGGAGQGGLLRRNLLRRFDCALSTSANSGLRNRCAYSGAVRNLSARTRGVAFIALVVAKIDRQMLLSTGARHFNQFAFRILCTDAVPGFHNWCWITAGRHA